MDFLNSTVPSFAEPSKKILCLTVPKAGTHLLGKTIEKLTGQAPCWISRTVANELDTRQAPNPNTTVFITHLFADLTRIQQYDPDKIVKILLIRDPRDTMVSFQHYLAGGKNWPFGSKYDEYHLYKKSLDEQLRYVLKYTLPNPKDSLNFATTLLNDPNILVIRFEDLVGEKGGGSAQAQQRTLDKLARTLGYSYTQSELDEIAQELFGGTGTFRQGQIGAWKSAYNEKNKALFKKLLGQTTIDLGYATDLDW